MKKLLYTLLILGAILPYQSFGQGCESPTSTCTPLMVPLTGGGGNSTAMPTCHVAGTPAGSSCALYEFMNPQGGGTIQFSAGYNGNCGPNNNGRGIFTQITAGGITTCTQIATNGNNVSNYQLAIPMNASQVRLYICRSNSGRTDVCGAEQLCEIEDLAVANAMCDPNSPAYNFDLTFNATGTTGPLEVVATQDGFGFLTGEVITTGTSPIAISLNAPDAGPFSVRIRDAGTPGCESNVFNFNVPDCDPCDIGNVITAGPVSCVGNSANFNVNYMVSGSNQQRVRVTASSNPGIVAVGDILGSSGGSPINATVPNVTAPVTISIVVEDPNPVPANPACISDPIQVNLPNCVPCVIDPPIVSSVTCNGNDAQVVLSYSAQNGAPTQRIVAGANTVGITPGTVLATGVTSPATVNIPAGDAGTIDLRVEDTANPGTCRSAFVTAQIPDCVPCSITGVGSTAPACNGGNAEFNITYTGTDVGGTQEVVAASNGFGFVIGDVIATGAGGSIAVSFPTAAAGSLTVQVRDQADPGCISQPFTVSNIPNCSPCAFTGADLAGAPTCNGTTASFTINYTGNNLSGTQQLIAVNSAFGFAAGQVITTGSGGSLTANVPNATAAGTLQVRVRDLADQTCLSPIVDVAIPNCDVCEINNAAATQQACNGSTAFFNVTFDAMGGSNFKRVVVVNPGPFGLNIGDVIGFGGASPISASISNATIAGTVQVRVEDLSDPTCQSAIVDLVVANPCPADPDNPAIPTMGEWALFILGLVLLNTFSLMLVNARQLSTPEGTVSGSLTQFVFRPSLYKTAMKHALGLAIVGFTAIFVIWGTVVLADLIGMAIAIPLVAYLIHLGLGDKA